MDKFFFPLLEGYYYGTFLHKELKDKLGDMLVQDSHATGLLCQAVVNAGHGDYIEIGSLYGGSAITAALTKKEFKLKGDIFCIDPKPRDIHKQTELFEVNDRVVVYSGVLKDFISNSEGKFSCAFIDGDHRPPHPLEDAQRLFGRLNGYLIFDDYDKSEVGVQKAVERIMHQHWLWRLVHFSDAIVIFKWRK